MPGVDAFVFDTWSAIDGKMQECPSVHYYFKLIIQYVQLSKLEDGGMGPWFNDITGWVCSGSGETFSCVDQRGDGYTSH